MIEETEVVVRSWLRSEMRAPKNQFRLTEGVIMIGHHVGERVGYISTRYDLLRLIRLVRELSDDPALLSHGSRQR